MGNLAGIVTAELHGYCGTNKAVLGWLMVWTEPNGRVVIVPGKGWFEVQCVSDVSPFLTQTLWHMDIPGQKPVCHGWGRGVGGNRKGDVTSRKGHAAGPSPEQYHQESGSFYF